MPKRPRLFTDSMHHTACVFHVACTMQHVGHHFTVDCVRPAAPCLTPTTTLLPVPHVLPVLPVLPVHIVPTPFLRRSNTIPSSCHMCEVAVAMPTWNAFPVQGWCVVQGCACAADAAARGCLCVQDVHVVCVKPRVQNRCPWPALSTEVSACTKQRLVFMFSCVYSWTTCRASHEVNSHMRHPPSRQLLKATTPMGASPSDK